MEMKRNNVRHVNEGKKSHRVVLFRLSLKRIDTRFSCWPWVAMDGNAWDGFYAVLMKGGNSTLRKNYNYIIGGHIIFIFKFITMIIRFY